MRLPLLSLTIDEVAVDVLDDERLADELDAAAAELGEGAVEVLDRQAEVEPPARDTRPCMTGKAELRDSLRVRRARLWPEDVGIQTTGQRRVPGLRRAETPRSQG